MDWAATPWFTELQKLFQGKTPLQYAIESGDYNSINFLLREAREADRRIKREENEGPPEHAKLLQKIFNINEDIAQEDLNRDNHPLVLLMETVPGILDVDDGTNAKNVRWFIKNASTGNFRVYIRSGNCPYQSKIENLLP